MEDKTMIQFIADHLIEHGYKVYAPTQAIGVVKEPYVVIRYLGGAKHASFSTIIERYSIIIFLPHRLYNEIQRHVQGIEDTMRKLHPRLIYDNFGGFPLYEDHMQCYLVSTDYLSYKRMNTQITPLRKPGG